MVFGEDQEDAVWTRWVNPHLKEESKAPGTLISYLTSLQKFITFVTSKKYDSRSMPSLHPNYKVWFGHLIPALKSWRETVDATTQDRQ